MKHLDPPVILIWNQPFLIGCWDLQNGETLKSTSIVLPYATRICYTSWREIILDFRYTYAV
jgi:hypothetical protein